MFILEERTDISPRMRPGTADFRSDENTFAKTLPSRCADPMAMEHDQSALSISGIHSPPRPDPSGLRSADKAMFKLPGQVVPQDASGPPF